MCTQYSKVPARCRVKVALCHIWFASWVHDNTSMCMHHAPLSVYLDLSEQNDDKKLQWKGSQPSGDLLQQTTSSYSCCRQCTVSELNTCEQERKSDLFPHSVISTRSHIKFAKDNDGAQNCQFLF